MEYVAEQDGKKCAGVNSSGQPDRLFTVFFTPSLIATVPLKSGYLKDIGIVQTIYYILEVYGPYGPDF